MSSINLNNDCVGCLQPVLLDGTQAFYSHSGQDNGGTRNHVVHVTCQNEWNRALSKNLNAPQSCLLCDRVVTCIPAVDQNSHSLNNDCVGCLRPVVFDGKRIIYSHAIEKNGEIQSHLIHGTCQQVWDRALSKNEHEPRSCLLCEQSVTCIQGVDPRWVKYKEDRQFRTDMLMRIDVQGASEMLQEFIRQQHYPVVSFLLKNRTDFSRAQVIDAFMLALEKPSCEIIDAFDWQPQRNRFSVEHLRVAQIYANRIGNVKVEQFLESKCQGMWEKLP